MATFASAMKGSKKSAPKGMAYTENGALSHASTGCDRLNYFSKVLRDSTPDQIAQFLGGSWAESPLDAMKLVAQKRDCRGGSGEKKVFYESMRWVIGKYPDAAEQFLPLIPTYGTWKDGYMCFCGTSLEEKWITFVADQLKKDLATISATDAEVATDKKDAKDGKDAKAEKKHTSVSLCAKWAPSEKSALSTKFPGVYDRMVKALGLKTGNKGRKDLRKTYLTPLREYIDVVERLMCGGQWNDIKYKNVPSVAMKRLRKAFDRNDKERFKTYLDNVSKGKEKINAGQLFPHDMVRTYMNRPGGELDAVIEEQWKAYVKKTLEMGELDKAIVLSDVSGSMNGQPMEVSIALGLLIATVAKGPFKGNVITFETNPTFHEVDVKQSLQAQVRCLQSAPWGGSTDFQAVFNLILSKAEEAKLKQEDMPKTLVVISDMQFNQAGGDNFFTNFETIKAKYRASGYDMPKIVFWNVRGATEDFPVTKDEYGVCLVSGFTPCHLKYLVSGVVTTPYDMMRETLDSERYKPVTVPDKYNKSA